MVVTAGPLQSLAVELGPLFGRFLCPLQRRADAAVGAGSLTGRGGNGRSLGRQLVTDVESEDEGRRAVTVTLGIAGRGQPQAVTFFPRTSASRGHV